MRFIAIQEGREDLLRDLINLNGKGEDHEDILYSEDQATVADFASARARQTKKNWTVYKLTEVLLYRGIK